MSVLLESAPVKPPLVIARHRHLKWKALDPPAHILMVLCGISIIGFTSSGFIGWGVFIGMAAATRRMDHFNLVEITKGMSGPKRTFMETFNRIVVLAVGAAMLVFGIQNFFNDMCSYRAPSLIPLSTYTASVPVAGALIVLFCIEQLVNGWLYSFEGPEDVDDFAGILK